MKLRRLSIFCSALLGVISFTVVLNSPQLHAQLLQSSSLPKQSVYVENKGQYPTEVLYRAGAGPLTMWVGDHSLVYDLRGEAQKTGRQFRRPTKFRSQNDEMQDELTIPHHVVRLEFVGAAAKASRLPGNTGASYNYFLGNDTANWQTNVSAYSAVWLRQLYSGVDMVLGYRGSQPRFDLIIAAGTDINSIQMKVSGADAMHVDENGALHIQTSCGEIVQGQLYAYQGCIFSGHQQVPCRFQLKGNTLRFDVGSYDHTRPLTIDPTIFTTYLGGNDVDVINSVLRVPSNGNVIAVGYTQSPAFPRTTGAYNSTNYGAEDIFVVQYDPKLQTYVYAAYIGGASTDIAWGAALSHDGKNSVFVCGETSSSNFPVTSGVVSQIYRGSTDAFVLQLTTNGDRLQFSTYHGGTGEDRAYAITVDDGGNCYYCGETYSTNFTVKSSSFKTVAPGNGDGFAASLSPGGGLFNYATYLGGSGHDRCLDIGFSGTSDVSMVVVGETKSNDFPLAPSNVGVPACAQTKINGTTFPTATDAFITKLNSHGADLVYSTYLGGNGDDYASAVSVDVVGLATVGGSTKSTNLTTVGEYQSTKHPLTDGFLAQVNLDGSVFPYLTYLGGNGNDYIHDVVAVDGYIFVVGQTFSNDLQATSDAAQQNISELGDGFVIKMRKNSFAYASYYGGLKADSFNCIALVDDYSAFIGGTTETAIGTSDSVAQRTFGGVTDGLLTKFCFSNLDLASPQPASKYCAGSPLIVSWTASQLPNNDAFMLEYSSDNGKNWSIVKTGLTNHTYTWIIPTNTASSSVCKLRVTHSSSGFTALNTGNFSILSAPTILRQSPDTALCIGTSLKLSVRARGDGLQYQWRKDGHDISGANDSLYKVDSITNSDAAQYDVVIKGECGIEKSSDPITVRALRAPKIVQNLSNQTVLEHQTATLTVAVSGTNLHYIWQKFKANMTDAADSSSLVLHDVSLIDYARYRVIVIGDCGTDTSAEVFINVNTDDVPDASFKTAPSVHLYPNPASDNLRVELSPEVSSSLLSSLRLCIVNTLGEKLTETSLNDRSISIDLRGYSPGVYHLVAANANSTLSIPFVVLR